MFIRELSLNLVLVYNSQYFNHVYSLDTGQHFDWESLLLI